MTCKENNYPPFPPIVIKGKAYNLSDRTYVMGIINLTPDSFSGDGLYGRNEYIDLALKQAEEMVALGVDFLDIGAESSRPGAPTVSEDEEKARLLPVLKELIPAVELPVSVDTMKPGVAEAALKMGAAIINDIWGLKAPDDSERRMARIVAEAGVPIILMHNRLKAEYAFLIEEMIDSLNESIAIAVDAGVRREQIIIDPGVGFGKTYEHNLHVLKNLDRFQELGRPILLGTSRKSVIGLTLHLPVTERLEGTIATVVWGINLGANIVRVHDVSAVSRAVKMCDAIRNS